MFIAFEGLDGSGSSTQSQLLKDHLEKQGKEVILTKEPTDQGPIGILVRETLQHKHKLSPEALQLLFCADRAEHLHSVVQPALNEGKIVITDRYFFSTLAYGSLKCDFDWLKSLNQSFSLPGITFLLKLDPEVCLKRIASRGSKIELFEKKETLKKVWEGYEKVLSEYPNIHLIDASRGIEEVAGEVWGKVEDFVEDQEMLQNKEVLQKCYQDSHDSGDSDLMI